MTGSIHGIILDCFTFADDHKTKSNVTQGLVSVDTDSNNNYTRLIYHIFFPNIDIVNFSEG
jgi:hypothetical protein